jgi:hypothetical protein
VIKHLVPLRKFPFDGDLKWRTVGDYLRFKLGLPKPNVLDVYCERLEADGDDLFGIPQLGQPKLRPGSLYVGDVLVYDDIRIERLSQAVYVVKRGFLLWKVTGGSAYVAAADVINTLNCPPDEAELALL